MLLKVDSDPKLRFYENQSIQNNWGVRDLKRAIESLLYERTGFSTDKETALKEHRSNTSLKSEEVFRNTYLLEFLGVEEKLLLALTERFQSLKINFDLADCDRILRVEGPGIEAKKLIVFVVNNGFESDILE